MFRKALMALAATATLALAAGLPLAPASANYSFCTENPSAKGCPGDFNVKDEAFYVPPRKSAEHHPERPIHHHG